MYCINEDSESRFISNEIFESDAYVTHFLKISFQQYSSKIFFESKSPF